MLTQCLRASVLSCPLIWTFGRLDVWIFGPHDGGSNYCVARECDLRRAGRLLNVWEPPGPWRCGVRRVASIFLPMWPIDLIRRRRRGSQLSAIGSQRESTSSAFFNRKPKTGSRQPQAILVIALERGVQI